MQDNWKTTINELIEIYRGALVSIIPWIERAKIKWKEGESYDDWDNITTALYQNIICSTLMGEVKPEYPIAMYDIQYDDYKKIDYIRVISNEYRDLNLVFVAFQNLLLPLDGVKVAVLDETNSVNKYMTIAYEKLEFEFVKNKEGREEVIQTINVSL